MKSPKVLLHVCCGVCATSVIERLREEGFDITAFFYNPNIHPQSEYLRRKETFIEVAERMKFPYMIGEYEVSEWMKRIKGFEKEPEGGKRCGICFKFRLMRTYEKFREGNFSYFTTTLTVSPYKNAEIINSIGKSIDKEAFLERNFKKKDGFKRSIELAKKWNLYRQDYCGCVFSKMERERARKFRIENKGRS